MGKKSKKSVRKLVKEPSDLAPVQSLVDCLVRLRSLGNTLLRTLDRFERMGRDKRLPKGWAQGRWESLYVGDDPEIVADDQAALDELAKKKTNGTRWGETLAKVIVNVRRFRRAIDEARALIPSTRPWTNVAGVAPIDQRAGKLDRDLRRLRSSLSSGQPDDFFTSDLPWATEKVRAEMALAIAPITNHREDLKSLLFSSGYRENSFGPGITLPTKIKGWTTEQLKTAPKEGVSPSTLNRIRVAAKLKPKPGRSERIFPPAELRVMIAVAPSAAPECANFLVPAWRALLKEGETDAK